MQDIKLCKDCKFMKRDWTDFFAGLGYRYAWCRHPKFKITDPIEGKEKYEDKFCRVERNDWGTLDVCGPKAKYFESKK